MKSLRKVFIAVMLVLPFLLIGSNSSAYVIEDNWTLDLSSLGLGTYSNIDRIDVTGSSNVSQSFGTDGLFNNGDTFSEYSQLNQLNYYTEPGAPADVNVFSLNGNHMYIYATGLTGYATNVSATDPLNLATYQFDYVFNPHVGTIRMYIDNDFDPTNGGTVLTTFDLLFGAGIGNPGFLGGATPNGTTNITSEFINPLSGVFLTDTGLDFALLPPGMTALGLLNTNNQVAQLTVNTGPTGVTGFNAVINSAGQMNVSVPEPATMLLLGSGLLGLAVLGRKKNFFKKD